MTGARTRHWYSTSPLEHPVAPLLNVPDQRRDLKMLLLRRGFGGRLRRMHTACLPCFDSQPEQNPCPVIVNIA
jgi:hypothetical protein